MSAVTKEDIAKLHSYLVVPMAVNDLLSNATQMGGEDQYALHVMLSEIEPDSALLAIALSAQCIASQFYKDIPVATALQMESSKIISDYGPDWLDNFHNHPVQGDDLFDLLCHVPEDLEALADLLDSLQASIRDENHPAHAICTVLSVQARAHMDIADYVLTELENEMAGLEEDADGICAAPSAAIVESFGQNGDNIILFPVHRIRH